MIFEYVGENRVGMGLLQTFIFSTITPSAMSHEHGKQKSERYSEDAHLTGLANEICKIYDGSELRDASTFQKRIIFTNSSLGEEEIAGKCKKIDGAIRFLWGNDFLILIHKPTWDASPPLEKTRILVHELLHIAEGEDGEALTRKHGGDFCAIPSHDKQSYRIAEGIYQKLRTLKEFQTQQEIIKSVPPIEPIPA